jgi:hypothetical protein
MNILGLVRAFRSYVRWGERQSYYIGEDIRQSRYLLLSLCLARVTMYCSTISTVVRIIEIMMHRQ